VRACRPHHIVTLNFADAAGYFVAVGGALIEGERKKSRSRSLDGNGVNIFSLCETCRSPSYCPSHAVIDKTNPRDTKGANVRRMSFIRVEERAKLDN
jgi:hypothetical protein